MADDVQAGRAAVAVSPLARRPRRLTAGPIARRVSGALVPVVGTLGFVALLQVVIEIGIVSKDAIPVPTDIIRAFVETLQTSDFWVALGNTMRGWAIGLGIATVAGISLGIAAGTSEAVFRSVRFLVDFFRPIPSIAILPVLILILGITMQVKITLAALAAFFPLFFATLYGVHDLDPVARDTATVYRVPRVLRLLLVSLPGSTPYIATGLRISASVALLLTVGTEMVVGLPGIGRAIFDAQYAGKLPQMYALVAASGILGILISACFRLMERRVLRWHPSQTKELV